MKRPLLIILILMSLSVAGILGLQLYWNYQNYKTTVRNFDHDINEALVSAVARETNHRQDQIVERFKGWMKDTALITVTADHNNRDSMTVFYTQDAHPKFEEDKKRKFQFGLNDFKQRLDHITPGAKNSLINHFAQKIVKRDLQQGFVYSYTQMLGDSLGKVFNDSKVDLNVLAVFLKQELSKENINTAFLLNPSKSKGLYFTKPVNTNFRKPYKNDSVYAGFENPNVYFFKEMKWVIISSFLLVVITISCFIYTAKVLLSQQKLAALKEDFVNNITHELNTPISSIKITAEALKTFSYEPGLQAEYLDIITYQADKLNGLTNQILGVNRMAFQNIISNEINLIKIIVEAITDLKPQTEDRNALINFHPPENDINIIGERSGLLNVLINLLDNALKYSKDRPFITIEVSKTNSLAVITVADNGIGIPQEYQKKVFDKFFRVPHGNVHDVKGFGLGLDYVRKIINQHNGKIFITDNDPTGSIFTINLPLL
ncbi:sensor histidine kinase [Mucilaginibacter ginkgonis]|uniref:histidine kinase n=1 Tax=Mucilaginibacter ginkgonis TaxID=2682091 RepID=A0A6I4HVA2_9SPHI|nr:HAMP domain-containing sensor histidine kinase [Mucilaginibacter ginkgonis]QQL49940.1 HAMP domain-containing histidine kinase [Mucilaginibacter ginkgonis]